MASSGTFVPFTSRFLAQSHSLMSSILHSNSPTQQFCSSSTFSEKGCHQTNNTLWSFHVLHAHSARDQAPPPLPPREHHLYSRYSPSSFPRWLQGSIPCARTHGNRPPSCHPDPRIKRRPLSVFYLPGMHVTPPLSRHILFPIPSSLYILIFWVYFG